EGSSRYRRLSSSCSASITWSTSLRAWDTSYSSRPSRSTAGARRASAGGRGRGGSFVVCAPRGGALGVAGNPLTPPPSQEHLLLRQTHLDGLAPGRSLALRGQDRRELVDEARSLAAWPA